MYPDETVLSMRDEIEELAGEVKKLRKVCVELVGLFSEMARPKKYGLAPPPDPQQRMTVRELSELSGRSEAVIRDMCRAHMLPHYRTHGRRIYFIRDEILQNEELMGKREATDREVDDEAMARLGEAAINELLKKTKL